MCLRTQSRINRYCWVFLTHILLTCSWLPVELVCIQSAKVEPPTKTMNEVLLMTHMQILAHLSSRDTVAKCCSPWRHSRLSGGCREDGPAADVSQEVFCNYVWRMNRFNICLNSFDVAGRVYHNCMTPECRCVIILVLMASLLLWGTCRVVMKEFKMAVAILNSEFPFTSTSGINKSVWNKSIFKLNMFSPATLLGAPV